MELHGMSISEAARRLEVTPKHLRTLEGEGKIPRPRRGKNGRIYTVQDIERLRDMGVGERPGRLKPNLHPPPHDTCPYCGQTLPN